MRNGLEIRHCRVLVALSDHGSISAAARALGLAQSTISETLLSLERLIDAPLTLRRRGQESTLTVAASALLPHARALISASEAALAIVNLKTEHVIRLGSVESASTFLLPDALATFRKRWPSIELRISIGVCDELRRRVQSGELDVAITVDSANEVVVDSQSRRVIAPTQLCLFVSRRKTWNRVTLSQKDLVRHPLLFPDPDSAFNALIRDWFTDQVGRPRMESAGSVDGVKIGVRNGDYVGVLPDYAVTKELASGEFVRLRVRVPLPVIALGLTTRYPPPVEASPLHDMIQHIERALIPDARSDRTAMHIHH